MAISIGIGKYYNIKPSASSKLSLRPSDGNDLSAAGGILSSAGDQPLNMWYIGALSTKQLVLNAANQSYCMNISDPIGAKFILTHELLGAAGNIDFVSAGNGLYYIKTYDGNFYLSYTSATEGAAVFWGSSLDKKTWTVSAAAYPGPKNYVYMTYPASECTLRIIRTDAGNLVLKNLFRKNLATVGAIGMNGGFFNSKKPPKPEDDDTITDEAWDAYWDSIKDNVLSITKYNGAYVTPRGMENGKSGNLVIYRTSAGTFGTVEVNYRNASEIPVIAQLSGSGSWAQGGAGMYLGDSSWQSKTKTNFTSPESDHLGLTAFVVDAELGVVYLIITTAKVNYIQFRSAIMKYLRLTDGSAASTRFLGEFLDGGGSTQLRAYDASNQLQWLHLENPGRKICGAVTLRDTT